MTTETVQTDSAPLSRFCQWCGSPLDGKRPQAKFCSDEHRTLWHRNAPAEPPEGTVRGVRRLAGDRVSVVVHLAGDDAERALRMRVGDGLRLVRPPEAGA